MPRRLSAICPTVSQDEGLGAQYLKLSFSVHNHGASFTSNTEVAE